MNCGSGDSLNVSVGCGFNPNARQLEGELQFPLLDGQRVIGMAMDVNGKLRDAVPVDKTRGQEVFEEVTRAQIDPAQGGGANLEAATARQPRRDEPQMRAGDAGIGRRLDGGAAPARLELTPRRLAPAWRRGDRGIRRRRP